MAFQNPSSAEIRVLLRSAKTIAVVGLSNNTNRPSHRVAQAMKGFGYRIIPVRPGQTEVLGEKAYARLADLPEKPDIVDVFRNPEHVAGIVGECMALGLGNLWLQEGVIDEAAAETARSAGIFVVMDRCIWKEHRVLFP